MLLLEAYKFIPRKGNIIRLYEFRGRFFGRGKTIENGEPMLKTSSSAKYMIVLAENLADAVASLHKCYPAFVPDKALCHAAMKIEWDESRADTTSNSGA